MGSYRAAVIACGRRARAFGQAFRADERVRLAACADVSTEALAAYGEEFGVGAEHRYLDYRLMLERERPEIVAIVSQHHLHAEMTIAAARAAPRAIICEKPIALTLPDADAMIAACREAGTTLIIAHQRRFDPQNLAARELITRGAIGEISLIEAHGHPHTSLLVDGTHTVDLISYFLDDEPVDWVVGQIDASQPRQLWGHTVENLATAWFKYRRGTRVLLTCGGVTRGDTVETLQPRFEANYQQILIQGTTGRIEIDGDAPWQDRPIVRLVRDGRSEAVPLPFPIEGDASHRPASARQVELLLDYLDGKRADHPLEARRARATLEVLIAVMESARRRGVVQLPIAVEDYPLQTMLDAGELMSTAK
ncbi:MAG TPA: Gfo/Idh/MocA family oxidoreductase [Chloroflexota bacterium]|nr:Gfo/Idh/MocA family oxidoreductase [Chloroflexota bacterium]